MAGLFWVFFIKKQKKKQIGLNNILLQIITTHAGLNKINKTRIFFKYVIFLKHHKFSLFKI